MEVRREYIPWINERCYQFEIIIVIAKGRKALEGWISKKRARGEKGKGRDGKEIKIGVC